MKIKLKLSPELEAKAKAGAATRQQRWAQMTSEVVRRAKQTDGTASNQVQFYVSDAVKAHLTQLAMVEQRSISSICTELVEFALGQVESPQEAAASEAIIQRGQNPRDFGDIAAATLEQIRRQGEAAGVTDIYANPPRPTEDDLNQGRFNHWTQQWAEGYDPIKRTWAAGYDPHTGKKIA
mgnify:CR=1 FL=1